MNSLNPVMRIKAQLGDTIRYHMRDGNLSQSAITSHIHQLLESVGLDRGVAEMYPHELSGGMKQRVCIAMGISLQPQVILADEPTSASMWWSNARSWKRSVGCSRRLARR
ncbi:MAG: ATP-binding cassette domain-containing protein [Caldilineaceae bacterium]